jgi:hypothetical protein
MVTPADALYPLLLPLAEKCGVKTRVRLLFGMLFVKDQVVDRN